MGSLFIIDSDKRTSVTAEELCKLFKVDIDRIKKNPVFKNNRNKRGKPNYLRSKTTSHILPYFRTKHPETGLEVTIRYAESWNVNPQTKEYRYEPARVSFYGEKFGADFDTELLVWFYINKMEKKGHKYEYVDSIKIAEDNIKNIDNLERALSLSRTISEGELAIILKGLSREFPDIVGNVEIKDAVELRSSLREIAAKYPDRFLANVQGSPRAKVEGTILQLVDKGAITLMNEGPYKQWKFTEGPYAGEAIGEQIKNPMSDLKGELINEIIGNPDDYKHKLSDTLAKVHARVLVEANSDAWGDFSTSSATSAINELADSSILSKKGEDISTQVTGGTMVTPEATMNGVREFMDLHGFSKKTEDVSLMRKHIEEGVINDDTIYIWCQQNLKMAKK